MRGPRPACQCSQARGWRQAVLPVPRDRPTLARIFWRLLDALDYRVMQARLWVFDALHGPEPETEADRQREESIKRSRASHPSTLNPQHHNSRAFARVSGPPSPQHDPQQKPQRPPARNAKVLDLKGRLRCRG
jgi:hypothetical protein